MDIARRDFAFGAHTYFTFTTVRMLFVASASITILLTSSIGTLLFAVHVFFGGIQSCYNFVLLLGLDGASRAIFDEFSNATSFATS